MQAKTTTSSCKETSFNTFEEISEVCGQNYDPTSRGAITKDFNLGLSKLHRKPLTVDVYNQGCLNPWGCAETFRAPVAARQLIP